MRDREEFKGFQSFSVAGSFVLKLYDSLGIPVTSSSSFVSPHRIAFHTIVIVPVSALRSDLFIVYVAM